MLVLGFHGTHMRLDEENRRYHGHDSAAVLLDDGVLVAAIEEERLNRVKHSNYFPVNAIKFCARQHGVALNDIDWFVFNGQESSLNTFARLQKLSSPDLTLPANGKDLTAHVLKLHLGIDVGEKLRFCNHHVAHAWSAFAVSGYQESLVLSVDGGGDNLSGAVFLHEGDRLTLLREFDLRRSLGDLYTEFIQIIGLTRFDEYKAMGLAPYGDPSSTKAFFKSCYSLLSNGEYDLHKQSFYEMLGRSSECLRRKGEPFKQEDNDFAAGLQHMLESIMMHLLGHYQRETKQKNLCLVGGVAHNCTMNGKVAYSGLFENMFVQPAAHDAGGALGAALSVFHAERPETPKMKLDHLFLGTDLGQEAMSRNRRHSCWQTISSWAGCRVVRSLVHARSGTVVFSRTRDQRKTKIG
jgi:carbamoyltransferase